MEARATMAVDDRRFRRCLGQFSTGVTVVTTEDDGQQPHGLTVNAFTSVSLYPPLVMVSIDRRARACSLLETAGYVVNVLAADQARLAWHFAGKPDPDMAIPWTRRSRLPALDGAIAHIDCEPWRTVDGGDHLIYLGHVHDLSINGGEPLAFHGGQLRVLGPAVDEWRWAPTLEAQNPGWLACPQAAI